VSWSTPCMQLAGTLVQLASNCKHPPTHTLCMRAWGLCASESTPQADNITSARCCAHAHNTEQSPWSTARVTVVPSALTTGVMAGGRAKENECVRECARVCTCMCVCRCVCGCSCVSMSKCAYGCMCVPVCVFMCLGVCVGACVRLCVPGCACACAEPCGCLVGAMGMVRRPSYPDQARNVRVSNN